LARVAPTGRRGRHSRGGGPLHQGSPRRCLGRLGRRLRLSQGFAHGFAHLDEIVHF
jgi:hypothetical protein